MNLTCFRCGHSAFATLTVEAAIGTARLEISANAAETGICAPCLIGLADWLEGGRKVEHVASRAALRVLARETVGVVG
jgi:hypothetical protein